MTDGQADDPHLQRFRKLSRPVRVVYARPRTFISILVGIAAFFLLPGSLRLGRSLAVSRGRQAVGVALVLTINVVVGLYPLPLLAAARL